MTDLFRKLIAVLGRRRSLAVALPLALLSLLCLVYIARHAPPWKLDRLWQRHADLKPAKIDDYIAFGLWCGAAFAALASAVLAATTTLWARPSSPEHCVRIGQADKSAGRAFWISLLVITVIAGALRAPRLGHAFWGDEGWAYSDLIGGRYSESADGSLEFDRHPWKTTLFWDKGLNNQYLFTIAARLSLDTWQKLDGAPPHAFSEAALRIPSLLAGLLSIIAAALLMRRLGHANAGLALAVLLAIHPWHLRYSAEARGYTMLILFLLLALLCLANALASDRRRWWVAFALIEFAALYTWKAAIHPFAAIDLTALAILVLRLRKRSVVPISRCVAANGFALLAFVPLFAPAIPQIALTLKKSTAMGGTMDANWFKDVTAHLLGAMDWANSGLATPFDNLTRVASHAPVAVWGFTLVVIPLLIVIGLVRFTKNDLPSAALLAAPLIGAALAFIHFKLNGTMLLKWYLFYTLPFLLVFLALGLAGLAGKRRWAWALPVAGFAALYLAVFGHHTAAMIKNPLQDTRGADAATRTSDEGRFNLAASDRITVELYRRVKCYDPRMRNRVGEKRTPIRTGEALMETMRLADAEGKSLRLTAANLPFAHATHPDFFEVLEDPRYFEKLGTFPAIEPYIQIEAWAYKPGSAPASGPPRSSHGDSP